MVSGHHVTMIFKTSYHEEFDNIVVVQMVCLHRNHRGTIIKKALIYLYFCCHTVNEKFGLESNYHLK